MKLLIRAIVLVSLFLFSQPGHGAELSDKEMLGKALFFDRNLSQPRGQSCSSCHDPQSAFSGNAGSNLGVAFGAVPGRFGGRNVPTAMYAKFSPPFHFEKDEDGKLAPIGGLFWDGRASTLEEQAKGPFFNPNEMNMPDHATLRDRIQTASYVDLMKKVFGDKIMDSADDAVDAAASAIAAFERTDAFSPFSSKYDSFRRGTATLTHLEADGLRLFKDKMKGNCISCHAMNDSSLRDEDNLFTDFSYDNLGIPRNRKIPSNAEAAFFDIGLCGPGRNDLKETHPELCGSFRVPTLRNVTKRKALFHNGVFSNLKDAVTFYATRETDPMHWYQGRKYDDTPNDFIQNINTTEVPYKATPETGPFLNDDEINAIVAFLGTLEDGYQEPLKPMR